MDFKTRYYQQDLNDHDPSSPRLFAIPRPPLPESPTPRTSRYSDEFDGRVSYGTNSAAHERPRFVQQQKQLIESRLQNAEARPHNERMQRRGAISYPSHTYSASLSRHRHPFGIPEPLPTLPELSPTQQQRDRKRNSDAAQLESYDGSQLTYSGPNQSAYDTPRKKRRLSEQPSSSIKPFSPATSPLKHRRAHSATSPINFATPLAQGAPPSNFHFANLYSFPSNTSNPSPSAASRALPVPSASNAAGSTTSTPPKKHTRPPISSLFASLCLSSPNFIALQAAAKAFMLDPAHPERQSCVGSKGRTSGSSTATITAATAADADVDNSSEAAKVRLGRVVREFLANAGAGERFWGADEMDLDEAEEEEAKRATNSKYGRGRQEILRWPRDADEIAARVTPLCRRMVTNERQRQYAIETRKGGARGSAASSPVAAKAAAVDLLRLARSAEAGVQERSAAGAVEERLTASPVMQHQYARNERSVTPTKAGPRGLQRKRGIQDLKNHQRTGSTGRRYDIGPVSPAKRRRHTSSVSSSNGSSSRNSEHGEYDGNDERAELRSKKHSEDSHLVHTTSNSVGDPSKRPRLSDETSESRARATQNPPATSSTTAGAEDVELALVPHVSRLNTPPENSNSYNSVAARYTTASQNPTTLRVTIVHCPQEKAQTLLTCFTHPRVSYALLSHLLSGHAAERRMRVSRVAALGVAGLVEVTSEADFKATIRSVEECVWMEGVVRVVAFIA